MCVSLARCLVLGLPLLTAVEIRAASGVPHALLLPKDSRGTKWFPGHYLRTFAGQDQSRPGDVEAFLGHSQTTGLLFQIDWKDLESKKDVYDFSRIDEVLALADRFGKVVHVKVQDRTFGGEIDGGVPAYMSEMGFVVPMFRGASIKGGAIKWWSAPCVDRLIALYQQMGKRYDLDLRFAGVTIGDGESALAVNKDPKTGDYSAEQHKDQLIRAARVIKQSFPHTPVFTGVNWMEKKHLNEIGKALWTIGGSGFIHPDTVPGTKFPATDVEIEYGKKGVPTFAQFQVAIVKNSASEQEILDWAVRTIGASMVSWNHYHPNRPDYVSKYVLPFLSSPQSRILEQTAACPAKLQPAITKGGNRTRRNRRGAKRKRDI